MVYLVWLGAPFLLGAVLGAGFARGTWSVCGLLALGALIGFFVVLGIYLNAPPDYAHSGGDGDGGMYFGRWWELPFVLTLVAVGYGAYLLGMVLGWLVRSLVRPPRTSTPD